MLSLQCSIFIYFKGESCYLSVEAKVCSSLYEKSQEGDAVVICGSPGEVGNGNFKQNIFRFYLSGATKFLTDFGRQKRNVWSMIALESPDQLRQRMAWALSQILAISPSQVSIPLFPFVVYLVWEFRLTLQYLNLDRNRISFRDVPKLL